MTTESSFHNKFIHLSTLPCSLVVRISNLITNFISNILPIPRKLMKVYKVSFLRFELKFPYNYTTVKPLRKTRIPLNKRKSLKFSYS